MMPTRKWAAVASLLPLVVALHACISPTENCASPRALQGTWQYSAVQESPIRATLTGSLMIGAQSCKDFVGTLDVVEVTAAGQTRRIGGSVNGVLLDASSARFTARIDGIDREHLAKFSADSVKGTWVQVSSLTAEGSFAGRLQGAKQ